MDIKFQSIYAWRILLMEMTMFHRFAVPADRALAQLNRHLPAERIAAVGQAIALAGVLLPLLLIGVIKFTPIEANALKPVIAGTPWLAWLYSVFSPSGASMFLGVVELATVLLLVASPWKARAGVVGGALGAATFAVTTSTMLALPIWEAGSGGFPFLNALGAFLIKDVALLGISLVVLGRNLAKMRPAV